MSNGDDVIVCCILGVCCPAGSAEQRAAVVQFIQKRHPQLSEEVVGKKADSVLKKYKCFRGLVTIIDKGVSVA